MQSPVGVKGGGWTVLAPCPIPLRSLQFCCGLRPTQAANCRQSRRQGGPPGAMLLSGRKLRRVRLFVGFSDDRRLEVLVWFGVAIFVLGIIIIVVGVSRRHRVADEGDD